MIPRWKLVREVKRIQSQIKQLPWFLYGAAQKNAYDSQRDQNITCHEGDLPLRDNLIVLLIYQPKGLLRSTIEQLQYFERKGYSTLVISNAPLSEPDLRKLQTHTFRVMVRKNYGYDFGGYRDGVLHVLENGIRPKSLIVMNDSVWFPAHRDSDPLQEVADNPADLVGLTYFHHARKRHLDHIQSYFFRFSRRMVEDPFFEEFWRDLPVSNSRYTVIRQCEMRLTNKFQSRGYSVDKLCSDQEASTYLSSLSKSELQDVTTFVDRVLRGHAPSFKPLNSALEGQSDWRHELEVLQKSGKSHLPFITLHPQVLLRKCKSPVLKKNRDGYYVEQRSEIVRLGMLSELRDSVAEEVKTWDAAR